MCSSDLWTVSATDVQSQAVEDFVMTVQTTPATFNSYVPNSYYALDGTVWKHANSSCSGQASPSSNSTSFTGQSCHLYSQPTTFAPTFCTSEDSTCSGGDVINFNFDGMVPICDSSCPSNQKRSAQVNSVGPSNLKIQYMKKALDNIFGPDSRGGFLSKDISPKRLRYQAAKTWQRDVK